MKLENSMSFRSKFKPRDMVMLGIGIPSISFIYYITGISLFQSKLNYLGYLEFSVLLTFIVTGCYQLYFWIQRNSEYFPSRCLKMQLDEYIPFMPSWVWIYSFLYYIGIGFVVVSIESIEQGMTLVYGGIILLIIQVICFFVFPCHTPIEWRKFEPNTLSEKFLYFIQGYDNNKNCFPSMHCSLSMYISMLLYPNFGIWSFTFVGLILLSCLFTKQHQILDTIPGVLLGYMVYSIFI